MVKQQLYEGQLEEMMGNGVMGLQWKQRKWETSCQWLVLAAPLHREHAIITCPALFQLVFLLSEKNPPC